MPWFKVDDNFAFHAKSVAAGNPAIGLWSRAGSWCAQQLTDGFVPDHILAALGTRGQADRLVEVGLWRRVEGGHEFHEWHDRQPSRVDVEAERAAAKDRMRAARAKKKQGTQSTNAQVSELRSGEQADVFGRSSAEVRDVFGQPDPTRPDPTHITSGASADDAFEMWWVEYPRKVNKGAAKKAYRAAAKKTDADTLLAAIIEQATVWKSAGTEERFIPHASSWLNGERWGDERPAPKTPGSDVEWWLR